MGYMRNHAIVVSDYGYEDWIEKAHQRATELFKWVSGISPFMQNKIRSFFIPPDGSKEGWEDSEIGDKKRATFINWLNGQKYEDGSSPLKWVEVQYGDDEGQSIVISHSEKGYK